MNGRQRLSWPQTAINLADDIAHYRSEDPYLQVGAVGVKWNKELVLGYNGAPSGVDVDYSDRDKRRPFMIHAEANVLGNVKPGELDFLAVTHIPCAECLKSIRQKDIRTVYYSEELSHSDLSKSLCEVYGIELVKLTAH